MEINILYISTVKNFSRKRLEAMLNSTGLNTSQKKELLSRLHTKDLDSNYFDKFMQSLEEMIDQNKIKMIILDSITGLSDVQFISENNEVDYVGRAMFLKRTLVSFKKLVSDFNMFFLVTNNVKGDIENDSSSNGNFHSNVKCNFLI
jgi:hypothetical protein